MYSLEIRQMSINIYNQLKSFRKTALLINISKSTIQRWNKELNIKIRKSRISKLNTPIIIKTLINNNPFITIMEIQKNLVRLLI